MKLVHIHDRQAWDDALLALPNPHVLQSWAWGEFKSRHGWLPTRLLFQEGDRSVAAATLLQRNLLGPGRLSLPLASVLYAPKGPALDWTDLARVERLLAALERLARERRALFVKIDPDVYHLGDAPAFASRPAIADDVAGLLAARGWRLSGEQIQFRNTVLLDLERSEDEILAAMKQRTRRNVRLAMRRGVAIRQGSSADLDLFYRLYAETAGRQGFAIRPPGYYLDAWSSFLQAGRAYLLLAEVEGEAVAGLVLFTFGPAAWYMYGASSDRHRETMPNYLLQWEAIRHARAAGCSLYDLWGAPDHLHESDPMWGVYRFKLGLGGELARGLGAWDFPANRAGYWLYSVAIPRYLGWLRAQARR